MGVTSDRGDPRLTHGTDDEPVPQAEVYLVLSDEERAKGFQRPLRFSYRHVGPLGPSWPLVDLTEDQAERYTAFGYVKFEPYPESERPKTGKYWTQAQLDGIGTGCGAVTSMGTALAETYARQPSFYGATYCISCHMHRPVAEFVWDGTDERVGS